MEEQPPSVDILLATYNGEEFLREQLDSIFKQTYVYYHIYIRDDGSTDQTLEIVKSYQQQYPEKITLIQDDEKNLGAAQNFSRLLDYSKAAYIAFCDQDDVWLPEKLEVALRELKKLEQANPPKPCLVYSDMKQIDENGTMTSDSVWNQMHLRPEYFTFNRLLIQNIPHGCAMVFNRRMKELVSPIPAAAILHDHWIAIVAAAMGIHKAVQQPLLLLRNHARNVTRKKVPLLVKIPRFASNILSDEAYEKVVQLRVGQARAVKERFALQLSSQQLHTLDQCILLGATKGLRRKWIYLKNGFLRTTFMYSLKMILRG